MNDRVHLGKFFDMRKNTTRIVKTSDLVSSKVEPDKSLDNASKFMLAAGEDAPGSKPRKPITITPREDGKYDVVDGNATTQVAQNAGHDEMAARIVDAHEADLIRTADEVTHDAKPLVQPLVNKLRILYPDAVISGRVKTTDSIVEKNLSGEKEEPDKDNTARGLWDVIGVRAEFDSISEVKAAADQFKNEFNVLRSKDYIANPKDGYRSIHFNIQVGDIKTEVQLRTPNQTKWADWMHDQVYKPHGTPEQNEFVAQHRPEILAYAQKMSDYYYHIDSRAAGDAHPAPCAELIRQSVGCL